MTDAEKNALLQQIWNAITDPYRGAMPTHPQLGGQVVSVQWQVEKK